MFKGLKSAMGLGLFFKDILALFLVHYWMTFQCETAKPKVIGTKMKKRPCSTYHVLNPLFG